MLILLPPSEGKRPGGRGAPVDLEALSFPGLDKARREVLETVVPLCADQPAKARAALGLSEALDEARVATARALTSAAMPAGKRYAGVLFDALDYPSLTGPALRRANTALVVLSALWGATRPKDRLPDYRLGIGSDLPGLGPLATYWQRNGLPEALHDAATQAGGALDLRSSGYAPAWRPKPEANVTVVRLQTPAGKAVPSFPAKHLKGELVRAVLEAGSVSVDALRQAAHDRGHETTTGTNQVTVLVESWPIAGQ